MVVKVVSNTQVSKLCVAVKQILMVPLRAFSYFIAGFAEPRAQYDEEGMVRVNPGEGASWTVELRALVHL